MSLLLKCAEQNTYWIKLVLRGMIQLRESSMHRTIQARPRALLPRAKPVLKSMIGDKSMHNHPESSSTFRARIRVLFALFLTGCFMPLPASALLPSEEAQVLIALYFEDNRGALIDSDGWLGQARHGRDW